MNRWRNVAAGVLAAALLSFGVGQAAHAQAGCLSPSAQAEFLAKVRSGEQSKYDASFKTTVNVLMRCTTLSPSGAALLRLGIETYEVSEREARGKLARAGYLRDALELDAKQVRTLYGAAQASAILTEARQHLGIVADRPTRALAAWEFNVAAQFGVVDQGFCAASIAASANQGAAMVRAADHEALYEMLYCGQKWRIPAAEVAAVRELDAAIKALAARPAEQAVALERAYVAAVELRSARLLTLAQAQTPKTAPDGTWDRALQGQVAALLAFGGTAEAKEAVRAACPNGGAAPSPCHLLGLAPGIWSRDATALAAAHANYRYDPDQYRAPTGIAPGPSAALIRDAYLQAAVAGDTLLNAGRVFAFSSQIMDVTGVTPLQAPFLDCALLAAGGGASFDQAQILARETQSAFVYGLAMTSDDQARLVTCLAHGIERAVRRPGGAPTESIRVAGPLFDGLPPAQTAAARVSLARSLLLFSDRNYRVEGVASAYLKPLLPLDALPEHQDAIHLLLRAAIDEGDRTLETQARSKLSPEALAALPATLKEDRPFRSADEVRSQLFAWRTDITNAANRRKAADRLSYLQMVADSQGATPAEIGALSQLATKRAEAAKVWVADDAFAAAGYRSEPLLCDRLFLNDYASWFGQISAERNQAVNALMPKDAIERPEGALAPSAFRPEARTVGRAVEDLEFMVRRAASQRDITTALAALKLRDQLAGAAVRGARPRLCRYADDLLYASDIRRLRLGLLAAAPANLSDIDRLHFIDEWLRADEPYRPEDVRAMGAEGRKQRAKAYAAARRTDLHRLRLDVEGVWSAVQARRESEDAYSKAVAQMTESSDSRRVPMAALQRQLAPHQALVLLGSGDVPAAGPGGMRYQTLTFLITKTKIYQHASSEIEATNDLLASIDALDVKSTTDLPPFSLEKAHRLYLQTVGPLLEKAPTVTTLFVIGSASDPLRDFPLSTLVRTLPPTGLSGPDAYRAAHWVLDDYWVVHLTSLSRLPEIKMPSPSGQTLAFSQPDYGATPAEIAEARRLLKERTTKLGDDGANWNINTCKLPPLVEDVFGAAPGAQVVRADLATESEFKRLADTGDLQRFGVLVFYSHGERVGSTGAKADPALALAPTPGCSNTTGDLPEQDGFLTGQEIAQFSLGDGWVVLAACRTATEPDLPEAFFAAGRGMVLGSAVSVFGSSTGDLVTRLANHQARSSRTDSAVTALREVKANPEWSHPAYWGAWRIIAR